MTKALIGAFLYAPMLVVLVPGLPLIVVLLMNGGRLLNRGKGIKKRQTRKKMVILGATHLFFGILPILLTPVSMIGSTAMYVLVFGALSLALPPIILGFFARKFRTSYALGIAQIVLGLLFALLLAALWWFITVKMHTPIF